MSGESSIVLTGLVFKAAGIHGLVGLEEAVCGLPGVADEYGFESLSGAVQDGISIMLTTANIPNRAEIAQRVVAKVLSCLPGGAAVDYVYAAYFPGRWFTTAQVEALRHVSHGRVSQIIGFRGGDFLQVWFNKLLPVDEVRNILVVMAAQTEIGFL